MIMAQEQAILKVQEQFTSIEYLILSSHRPFLAYQVQQTVLDSETMR